MAVKKILKRVGSKTLITEKGDLKTGRFLEASREGGWGGNKIFFDNGFILDVTEIERDLCNPPIVATTPETIIPEVVESFFPNAHNVEVTAPEVISGSIYIMGELAFCADTPRILVANFGYLHPKNIAESNSIYKFYMANNASGAGETLIQNSTSDTFTLTLAQKGKFIDVGIIPCDASGKLGDEVRMGYINQAIIHLGANYYATSFNNMVDGGGTAGLVGGGTSGYLDWVKGGTNNASLFTLNGIVGQRVSSTDTTSPLLITVKAASNSVVIANTPLYVKFLIEGDVTMQGRGGGTGNFASGVVTIGASPDIWTEMAFIETWNSNTNDFQVRSANNATAVGQKMTIARVELRPIIP